MLDDGKSIIVISDTHIGSEDFNHDDFCEFLEWMQGLNNNPEAVRCEKILDGAGNETDAGVILMAPEELILLGDILELWDPMCQNRDFTLTYSAKPFKLLEALKCRKVYVVGNHDEDLSELREVILGGKDYDKCKKPAVKESMESIFLNELKFEIYNRHYPPKNKETGRSYGDRIGKWTYFFLHGNQFDKFQVFQILSKKINLRIDPVDYLQDLANVSFTKEIYRNYKAFLIFIFAFGLSVYVYLFYKFLLFDSIFIFMLYLILTAFVIISLLPKLVFSPRKILNRLSKVTDKSAQEVVEESFTARPDRIYADVVVFGHTHVAGNYLLKAGWKLKGLRRIKKLFGLIKPWEEGRKKLFVNTGCWVGRDDVTGKAPRKVNTFAYIDKTGVYLFKWKEGAIECLSGFLLSPGS